MVNLTNNYKFIVTNKNTVTSDSFFNLFLIMVTGQLLQCNTCPVTVHKLLSSHYDIAKKNSRQQNNAQQREFSDALISCLVLKIAVSSEQK